MFFFWRKVPKKNTTNLLFVGFELSRTHVKGYEILANEGGVVVILYPLETKIPKEP